MTTAKPSEHEPHYHNNIYLFGEYYGKIATNADTTVYGYDTFGERRFKAGEELAVPAGGGVYGYVQAGSIVLDINGQKTALYAGAWFQKPDGFSFITRPETRVVLFQRAGYAGVEAFGTVEKQGRLKYIDGAHDTVLSSPVKFGEPCLNALFVPLGAHQTMHTHPSTRAGVIIGGVGRVETPDNKHELKEGLIFFLPEDGWHKFRTDFEGAEPLSLVAYHPDSDFGPSDQFHPMLNRTLIDGVSATADQYAHGRTK